MLWPSRKWASSRSPRWASSGWPGPKCTGGSSSTAWPLTVGEGVDAALEEQSAGGGGASPARPRGSRESGRDSSRRNTAASIVNEPIGSPGRWPSMCGAPGRCGYGGMFRATWMWSRRVVEVQRGDELVGDGQRARLAQRGVGGGQPTRAAGTRSGARRCRRAAGRSRPARRPRRRRRRAAPRDHARHDDVAVGGEGAALLGREHRADPLARTRSAHTIRRYGRTAAERPAVTTCTMLDRRLVGQPAAHAAHGGDHVVGQAVDGDVEADEARSPSASAPPMTSGRRRRRRPARWPRAAPARPVPRTARGTSSRRQRRAARRAESLKRRAGGGPSPASRRRGPGRSSSLAASEWSSWKAWATRATVTSWSGTSATVTTSPAPSSPCSMMRR